MTERLREIGRKRSVCESKLYTFTILRLPHIKESPQDVNLKVRVRDFMTQCFPGIAILNTLKKGL